MSPEAMRAGHFSRVRDNLIGKFQQGFEQIESAGFDSQEMEDDWNKQDRSGGLQERPTLQEV